jgi:hypothetical protein
MTPSPASADSKPALRRNDERALARFRMLERAVPQRAPNGAIVLSCNANERRGARPNRRAPSRGPRAGETCIREALPHDPGGNVGSGARRARSLAPAPATDSTLLVTSEPASKCSAHPQECRAQRAPTCAEICLNRLRARRQTPTASDVLRPCPLGLPTPQTHPMMLAEPTTSAARTSLKTPVHAELPRGSWARWAANVIRGQLRTRTPVMSAERVNVDVERGAFEHDCVFDSLHRRR